MNCNARIQRWPLLAAVLLPLGAVGAAELQTVVPREDTEVVLHNPDMGWVLYENFPLEFRANATATMTALPEARFEGCDHVAVMFTWSDVEREEGRFDWSRVDQAWDYWTQRGKSIHLRISTEPLFGWSHLKTPGGLGLPDWLLARIPDDQKKRRADGPMFGWHVDARNILYQERLRIFLQEANAHFTGPRSPALVDLRGFGRWGEWHTGYPYASLEDKRAALQAVLAIWSEAFPQRPLALSYSHDPDGPPELHAGPLEKYDPAFTKNYEAFLRFSAFDLALQIPNITLRRDGAGGAVCSNERKLSEFAYRALRRSPQASEFVASYSHVRGGGPAYVKWVVDDALSLHPNYIGLLGYSCREALDFMLERPDLVAHGLKNMGYRLVPLKVAFPKTIQAGQPFPLAMEWINRAAGRALRDYTLRVRLVREDGHEILATVDAGTLPTSRWLQGDRQTVRADALFPKIPGHGEVVVQIALHDPVSGRAIHLPLSHRTRDAFCPLGTLAVTAAQ